MLCFKIPLIRILWNPIKWSWSYKQFYYNTNLWQILIFHPLIPSIKERRKSENAEGWKAQFRKKLQWFCEYLEYMFVFSNKIPPLPFLRRAHVCWWSAAWPCVVDYSKCPLNPVAKIKINQKNAYLTYDNMYIIGFVFLRSSWWTEKICIVPFEKTKLPKKSRKIQVIK